RWAGLLRRERREVRAVDGISFRVPRGEMVGYIGPNGAGKSTTIKMLTGILVPSGGRLRVAGIDPSRERTRLARRIGVVFGQRTTLWWDLPLRDSYALVRRMYRIPDARYRQNLDRCVELLDLGALLDVPVRQLSLGQRMRGDIAAALLHDPEVLYLDVRVEGPRQWLAFPAGSSAAPIVAAVADGYPLVDLSVREPDIEDVIAKMLYPAGSAPEAEAAPEGEGEAEQEGKSARPSADPV
ncbi:ATP-binding cassette domain-containing protein, partial [Streptomyces sp. MCAF7]